MNTKSDFESNNLIRGETHISFGGVFIKKIIS